MNAPITLDQIKSFNHQHELYSHVKQHHKVLKPSPISQALSHEMPQEIHIEISKLRSALKFLSPDVGRGNGNFYDSSGQPELNNWLAVIWAIRGLDWECGKNLAIEWSKQSAQRYVDSEFNQHWDSYNQNHPNPVTIRSLYKRVKELGWVDSNSSSQANLSGYTLLGRSDILNQLPFAWRIKGVLPEYGIAAMYGPSGSGKSFLALDAAITISEGGIWFGRKTFRSDVVYVALEGESGYKNRISAWEKENARPLPNNFRFIFQTFNLASNQNVEDLIAVAPQNGVIVIDTLNRASPHADENSSKDMGEILSATKKIQSATNGLVLIIHHTGKDTSKGLRGHSSLFAALDGAIEITHSNKQRYWKIAKSKDSESGTEFNFSLNPVYLGIDADNEPISSCTIGIGLAGIITQRPPVGKHQKPAFGAIKKAISASSIDRISVEDATSAVSGTLTAIQSNRRNNRARALIQGLLNSAHLRADTVNGEDWISIN
jgi:ABC-type polar amino acid transport system ATPase subunit